MSGICGVISFDGRAAEPDLLRKMAGLRAGQETDHCRIEGPAGFARFPCGTGGAAGEQCLLHRQAGFLLAADLRLDNRQELIDSLCASGHLERGKGERGKGKGEDEGSLSSSPFPLPPSPFSDEGVRDAEVLIAAYRRWGDLLADHLQGASAIALWDATLRKLLLVRDRMGERALYWHQGNGWILFGSEPIRLLASGRVPRDYHLERILARLTGDDPEPTWSYFRSVARLPEGHMLSVSEGKPALRRYWSWEFVKVRSWERGAAAQALQEGLQQAVDRRTPAGRGIGVLLSSGLDSSSIGAEAATLLEGRGETLHAFTWASEMGDAIDERGRSSALILSRKNIREHVVQADASWPLSRYPEAYADPSDPETSNYPDLLLTTLELARQQGVTVLMNGIGGDPVIGRVAPDLALLRRGRLGTLGSRWRRLGLRRSMLYRHLRMTVAPTSPDWLTPEGRKLARDAGVERQRPPWRFLGSERRFRLGNITHPMNAAWLERFDRLSRRTGVRVVSPWHDADLASLVLSMPDGAVDPDLPEKSLLRDAMRGRLPEDLRVAPVVKDRVEPASRLSTRGLLHEERELVERLLGGSCLAGLGLIDGARLLTTYRQAAAQGRRMPRLWEIVTLECWLRARCLT
jgi:asparagine synthase (glutamine-hydrolysing)